MPSATNLRDCVILETLIKKQAANQRFHAAVGASPRVVLGAWGCFDWSKSELANHCFILGKYIIFFFFKLLSSSLIWKALVYWF